MAPRWRTSTSIPTVIGCLVDGVTAGGLRFDQERSKMLHVVFATTLPRLGGKSSSRPAPNILRLTTLTLHVLDLDNLDQEDTCTSS